MPVKLEVCGKLDIYGIKKKLLQILFSEGYDSMLMFQLPSFVAHITVPFCVKVASVYTSPGAVTTLKIVKMEVMRQTVHVRIDF